MAKRHFHSNPSFKLNCNEKSEEAAGTIDSDCRQERIHEEKNRETEEKERL